MSVLLREVLEQRPDQVLAATGVDGERVAVAAAARQRSQADAGPRSSRRKAAWRAIVRCTLRRMPARVAPPARRLLVWPSAFARRRSRARCLARSRSTARSSPRPPRVRSAHAIRSARSRARRCTGSRSPCAPRVWARVLPALSFGHALAAIHVSLAREPRAAPAARRGAARDERRCGAHGCRSREATASTVLPPGGRHARGRRRSRRRSARPSPSAWWARGRWRCWPRLPRALGGRHRVAPATRRAARRLEIRRCRRRSSRRGAVAAWLLESAVLWQAARFAGIELGIRRRGARHLRHDRRTGRRDHARRHRNVRGRGHGGAGRPRRRPRRGPRGGGDGPRAQDRVQPGRRGHRARAPRSGLLGRMRLRRRPERAPAPRLPTTRPSSCSCRHTTKAMRSPASSAASRTSCSDVPCVCLVVDDGSTDGTAAAAAAAGAVVVRHEGTEDSAPPCGRGLAQAVASGPAAVVFCDADGEYAPEELERLRGARSWPARPTTSSARASPATPDGCVPIGALGNLRAHAAALASSRGRRSATARAAIAPCPRAPPPTPRSIHDFNYAQVLTLDLLGQGLPLRRGADQLPVPDEPAARSCGWGLTSDASYPRSTAS